MGKTKKTMIEQGIIRAVKLGVDNPLPISWLGKADAPSSLPQWAAIDKLTAIQLQNLQAQIGYDYSQWDYRKIGPDNQLGRYQFTSIQLENYGLITYGANKAYGSDCVNRKFCWKSAVIRSTNSYSNYIYDTTTIDEFLNSTAGQDHLCYQILYDTYKELTQTGGIQPTDTAETIAGMIYVGWVLGDGAYNWRFSNIGEGAAPFNKGRYAITVLSQ
jgi:hypothetical protein